MPRLLLAAVMAGVARFAAASEELCGDSHDLELGVASCSAVIQTTEDGDVAWAYYNRGTYLTELDRHAQAIADFDAAIAREPDLAVAYGNRGVARFRLGELDAALADFDRALELDPLNGNDFYSRAVTLCALGRPEAAAKDFLSAAEHGGASARGLQILMRGADFYDGPLIARMDAPALAALDVWTRAGCPGG